MDRSCKPRDWKLVTAGEMTEASPCAKMSLHAQLPSENQQDKPGLSFFSLPLGWGCLKGEPTRNTIPACGFHAPFREAYLKTQ